MTRAFTLLELSIVLVIIGLIVGGVVAGQSLIRNAEISSVISDFKRFETAVRGFQYKYETLPGDQKTAYDYWGVAEGCTDNEVNSDDTGCNGDGDGTIDVKASGPNGSSEELRAWQFLTVSEFLKGNHSGSFESDGTAISGVQRPNSAVERGYRIRYHPDTYNRGGNFVHLAAGALIAQEAQQIDAKIDNGDGDSGQLITYRIIPDSGCMTDDYSADSAEYDLTNEEKTCQVILYLD